MPINDPVAIKFSNERIRPAADTLCRGYSSAKSLLAMWQAQEMSGRIPDVSTNVLEDGSPADGRIPIDGAEVNRVVEALQAFVDSMDSISSNTLSHFTNALKVSVNPTGGTNL